MRATARLFPPQGVILPLKESGTLLFPSLLTPLRRRWHIRSLVSLLWRSAEEAGRAQRVSLVTAAATRLADGLQYNGAMVAQLALDFSIVFVVASTRRGEKYALFSACRWIVTRGSQQASARNTLPLHAYTIEHLQGYQGGSYNSITFTR